LRKKILTREQLKYLAEARVARLATSDRDGVISLVPIVYAIKGVNIFFVADKKTKHSGKKLKRFRNISENPLVTVLVDNYSENWGDLSYLMLRCNARILNEEGEKRIAARELKKKYPQYGKGGYFPDTLKDAVLVRLEPERAVFWQNLHPSLA